MSRLRTHHLGRSAIITHIFVAHTTEDAHCAEQIRQDLEAKGYMTWRQPVNLQMSDILYPRIIETIILRSVAVILVWSSSAALSEWVEHQLLFAQRLRKPIIPVVLDGVMLPNTLLTSTSVSAQTPCTNVVAHLLQQSLLPAPESTEAMITLSEQAAHEFIRERKDAIDQAGEMLMRNEHQEAVLAILEYLAHNDLMSGVREQAQDVLDAYNRAAQTTPVPSFLNPDDRRHMFAVSCKKGHVSYFDKRKVCVEAERVIRGHGTGEPAEPDKLVLPCRTPGCGLTVVTYQDCEGYKNI